MSYLRQFSEIGRDDVDLAGGKGANLGELTRGPADTQTASC
jgi:rifampicin phosphotransferase